MSDELSARRIRRAELKAQYQSHVDSVIDPVIAQWREIWAEDCREKGRTIPFGQWCFVPLDPADEMSSPFEIANVYER